MTEQTIKADTIYNHEKYGNVLVTAIGEMYGEYTINSNYDDPDRTTVYFYDDYDGYGGLNPNPLTENVVDFAESVNELGDHDYVEM